ncbi:MAG: septum formation initiator family protein [Candidatus Omnitrophota bacterium]|jgi:cell division protein FtsB
MVSLTKGIIKKAAWILGGGIILIFLFLPGYSKIQELRDRNRDLEQKTKKLKIENALLEQELKRVENDALYQERILRDKMGVVRKNELPVKVIPEEKKNENKQNNY